MLVLLNDAPFLAGHSTEKIVVHEAVKSPDGCRKQKVDIYYRFIGKID